MEDNSVLDCISNLSKTVIHPGISSRKATVGSVCSFSIIIDKSDYSDTDYLKYSTNTLTLGYADEIIDRVVEYCISTMNVGEESSFNFSKEGRNFQAKIKLENVFFKPYIFLMTDEERFNLARSMKEQGVELFKAGKHSKAFRKFRLSFSVLKSISSFYTTNAAKADKMELDDFLVILYNNLASCQLFYKNFNYAAELCSKSLIIKPSVKAYYRRSLCLIELSQYDKAESDLKNVLRIEENNSAALEKLKLVLTLNKENDENYKTTVRRMFSM